VRHPPTGIVADRMALATLRGAGASLAQLMERR
jgi:hypothetical protein